MHSNPGAGELHAVGEQAVHGDRHGEREQGEADDPVRQPHRARRAARQRQLAVDPRRQQHLQRGQGERDGREHGLERDRIQPGPPEI